MIRRERVAYHGPEAGVYLVEITKAEGKRSKKGDQMIVLDFKNVANGEHLCRDWVMLEGKMRWAGDLKLEAIGEDPEAEAFDEMALIGRRVWLALVLDDFEGRVSLKVDGKHEGSHAGYWAESDKPHGAADPEAVADLDFGAAPNVDDVPF